MSVRRPVHLWFPGLHGFRGGIQVHLASLLDALRRERPAERFVVLVKNDAERPAAGPRVRFRVAGWLPARLRTAGYAALLAAEALLGRPRLLIVGHLHFAPLAHLLHRLTGTPYWVLAYGMEAWGAQPPRVARALRAAERVLSISGHTRRRLVEDAGVEPGRVGLLPPTFAEAAFSPGPKPERLLRRYGLRADQPVILTVCRLAGAERHKGYEQVLAALPRVREALPDAHYLLAGAGDDRARVERLVAERGLSSCVTLAGFVPDGELADHYRLCDVFAMPSRREGFGIVFVEAMASGRPALGGNADGAVDALRGGELGVLIDPDDVAGIADALVRVLRREHPLALLQRPDDLRRAAVEAFGPASFRRALARHLDAFDARAEEPRGAAPRPAAVRG